MKILKKDLEKLIKEAVHEQLVSEASMTRQHFQLIADVLKNTIAPDKVKIAFARALAKTNPGFNEDRFLQAAGGLETSSDEWV